MKYYLVTGGSGFIGSNFVRFLVQNDTNAFVINVDKLTYAGNPHNLSDLLNHPRYRFVQGDICDRRLMERLTKEADTVIHFASETHVDRSIDGSQDFIVTNVLGTGVLLEACQKAGRVRKFIHYSTDEVYGWTYGSFSETSPFHPTSPYSASKAGADLLVQSYQKTHRFPAIILRGCNHFGPYQFPEKVIPLFITNLIEGKNVPLYSRGENVREWIFVEDSCRAIQLILERGQIGEAYNIGSDHEVENLKLAKLILAEFGKNESSITFVKDRPAHDFRYRLQSQKIKQLGFKISESFEKRLKETVKWYQKHEDWWKPLKKDRYTIK